MGDLSGRLLELERQRVAITVQQLMLAKVMEFESDMKSTGFDVVASLHDGAKVTLQIAPGPEALAIEDMRDEASSGLLEFEDHPAAEAELAQEFPPAGIDRQAPDPGETHQGVDPAGEPDASSTSGAGDVAAQEDPAPRADAPQAAAQDDGLVDRQQVDQAAPVVTGSPWTEEEVAILVERTAAAMANASGTVAGIKEAADMIGRPFDATKTKAYSKGVRPRIDARVKEIFAQRLAAKAAKGAEVASPYPPGPRQAVAERPALSATAEVIPNWRRELRELLDGLGNPDPFTPAIDLEIIERQAKGEKAPFIAVDLGLDPLAVRKRVIALLPKVGMQEQARLLAELRLRAGVEAA